MYSPPVYDDEPLGPSAPAAAVSAGNAVAFVAVAAGFEFPLLLLHWVKLRLDLLHRGHLLKQRGLFNPQRASQLLK